MDQRIGELELKAGYFHDRKAFMALADLLGETFDIDISLVDRFGGPNPGAMPFGYFDADGRCIANFSAFSMPLIINGRPVRAVGYQSGAVRPEFRSRGLYRDLMRRAFDWADAQAFELGLLLTDKPSLYQPYGFRSVPQHAFHGPVPRATRPWQAARPLSLSDPADIDLVMQLLATRQPVSNVFAVVDQSTEFPLNACFDPDIRLSYLPDLDAVVAWKENAADVTLLDILAIQVPPLAEIAGALGVTSPRITVCFPPDRLDWPQGTAEVHSGYCDLMIRPMGKLGAPTELFMLSPMAEF